jgi:hypothetical protein
MLRMFLDGWKEREAVVNDIDSDECREFRDGACQGER